VARHASGVKLALVTAADYAAGMRLFCEVRAARWLLPWGSARVGLVRLSVVFMLVLSGRALVNAQAGPEDVLHAPPPAPPLTELDDSEPPAAATGKPAVSTSNQVAPAKPAVGTRNQAAPTKPAASASNARVVAQPAVSTSKAPVVTQPAVSTSKTAVAAQPARKVADRPAADSGVAGAAAPAPDELEESPGVPPPPPVDGDFAGRGAIAAASGDEALLPQDDFAAEAQEYVRPKKREYSVRIDLLNWLLLGRLSVELEVSVWKYLTVSLTPVFVLARSPIAINYAGLDDPLTQRSHGIGPLSGVSLGVGAWFWGEPFKGYVLRLELTNYGYSYRTADDAGAIDRVDFTERRLILFIGSHSRFGAFTFAGGFGLGYELNQQTRCGLTYDDGVGSRSDDCKGKQQIALDREIQERANLNGPLHPVYFQARFSIGVVF
jgi:hypothetical protein